MAKITLPTNFQDDILSALMNGKRRFRMETYPDGTVSFTDVSQYDQVGSNFGAAQINQTNAAVNAAADAGKIIDNLTTVKSTTASGYMAGALALKDAVGVMLTATLAANATTVSFTNAAITSTALIDTYADVYGVSPKTATVSGNTLTLTFTARSAAMTVVVVVRRNV